MTNKDNRDFDDFNFDDDLGANQDDFDDLSPSFDEEPGEDLPDLGDEELPEEQQRQGPSRTFIILAAIMIILFVIGLVAVIFLATRPQGPTDFDLTATAIVEANATTFANATLTQDAVIAFAATGTADALATDTPTPRPTFTPTFTPTTEPTLDPTEAAAAANATGTQVALEAAQTAAAEQTNIALTPQQVGVEAVAQTATALAALFGQQPTEVADLGQGGGEIPTQEGQPRPTALPDTGLLDDIVGGGSNSIGLLVLLGFGLVGVIMISRRLRAAAG